MKLKYRNFCYFVTVVVLVIVFLINAFGKINAIRSTTKLPLSVKNNFLSLETDTYIFYAGIPVEFYVSFSDDLFATSLTTVHIAVVGSYATAEACLTTNTDRVYRKSYYKIVQSFIYTFEREDIYHMILHPFTTTNIAGNPAHMSLKININVSSQVHIECQGVGEFFIDNTSVSYFSISNARRKALKDWTVITKSVQSCQDFKTCAPKWTIEKIHFATPEVSEAPQCLNKQRIIELDMEVYGSHIMHIPLPAVSRESGFIIQPFTLPPGMYQICNTISNGFTVIRHCTFLELISEPGDCQPFIHALQIKITPEPDEFTWALTDLTLNVTECYSIYGLKEAGYSGEIKYMYMWTCSGDVLCKSIQQKQQIIKTKGENYTDIELDEQGTSLFIPKIYQTVNTTVIFRFTVEYTFLFNKLVCIGSATRKVTFVASAYQGVSIKCYLNCFQQVNPELPLLIGLYCNNCTLINVEKVQINWSSSGLQQANISGNGTYYLSITDFSPHISTFVIRVKVFIMTTDTSYQISLGKVFHVSKILPDVVIQTTDYIQVSQDTSDVKSGNMTVYLPRYSISLDNLVSSIKHIFTRPLITTVTLIQKEDRNFPKRHGIVEYVLLRTLWAPLDFCIESANTLSKVLVQFSTIDGLHKINMAQNLFEIPTEILNSTVDIESMWLISQEADIFTVNDQTYLASISYAIEMSTTTAINVVIDIDNRNNFTYDIPVGLSQVENVADIRSKKSARLKYTPLNVSTKTSKIGTESVKKLSELVEIILNSMTSGQNNITYSNINLYLVAVIRMMSIQNYTLSILEKAIKILNNAHALHQTIFEDPASDDELIKLKLEALYTFSIYLLNIQKIIKTDLTTSMHTSAILNTIFTVAMDISDRIPWMYPRKKSITGIGYAAAAFWVDPFIETKNLILCLMTVKVVLSIEGLRNSQLRFTMNTFLNVAGYTVDKSVLPKKWSNILLSVPLLHVGVKMKEPTLQPFYIYSPGILNLNYDFDFQSATSTEYSLNISVYGEKNIAHDSDCLFFRVEAAAYFATLLTFDMTSKLKLGVRINLANKISEGIKSIDADKIILPQSKLMDLPCSNISTNPYTIFLPSLTFRQHTELKGVKYYYIIVGAEGNQPLTAQNFKVRLVQIGEEEIKIKCLKASCVQWNKEGYTSKDCYITHCSGGVPPLLSCRCDKGNLFTAGVGACRTSRFVVINREEIQLREFNFLDAHNFIIPAFIIFLWLLYLVFYRLAHSNDILEIPLVKTIALQGVFSPSGSGQYLICFVTGFGRHCGTMSIPFLTIIGTKNVSPRYKLEGRDFIFVNGSEIWLLVSVHYDLGQLKSVVLSLEAKYTKLSPWFVEKMFIKDMTSAEEWECFFNTWIPDKSNHNFPFVVSNAVQNRGEKMRVVFGSIFLRLWRNQHPVFGIVYNVPGSDFTKSLHVVFCFCSVHFLMLVCLLVYNVPKYTMTADPVLQETFSLKPELYTGAAKCALIAALPVYFLGILLQMSIRSDSYNIEWFQTIKQPCDRPNQTQYVPDHIQEGNDTIISQQLSTPVDQFSSTSADFSVWKPHRKSILQQNFQSSKTFKLPILISLVLMIVICVSISYYIFVLGLYFTIISSLEYLYIVCVAFIILIAIIYPFLVMVVAIMNIILYIYGRSFYGVSRDSVWRVRRFYATMPFILEMTSLDILETRLKTLGDVEYKVHIMMTNKHSEKWCKQLVLRKLASKKKEVKYNKTQSILFISIVLVIINVQVGSISNCFMQTKYVQNSIDVGRVTDKPAVAMTTEDVWNHLFKMFYTIKSWTNKTSTVPLTLLSAVRLRQIRVKPYWGNCSTKYPDPIKPRCISTPQNSEIETRDFDKTWNKPLVGTYADLGPYKYIQGYYFTEVVTESHHYPGSGYDALFTMSSKTPKTLEFLKQNKWIDDKTIALVVTINLVNIDAGLSTMIVHAYEFKRMAIFMYTANIRTFQLVLSQNDEFLLSLLVIFFSIMTLNFLILEVYAAFRLGLLNYITLSESWFMMLERCVSVFVILIFLVIQVEKKTKLRQISEAHSNEIADSLFIDFGIISELTHCLIILSCSLVVICFIKVVLQFQRNHHVGTFIKMIVAVSKLMFIPILNMIAFAQLGYLLFNTLLMYYRTIRVALATVIVLMLETTPLLPTIEAGGAIGQLYIFTLYCVFFYLILNFFIVLLNEAYSEIRHLNRKFGKT